LEATIMKATWKTREYRSSLLLNGLSLLCLIGLAACADSAFVGDMDPISVGTGGTTQSSGGVGGAGGATPSGGSSGTSSSIPDAGVGLSCAPITTVPGIVNPCGHTFGVALSPDGRFVATGIEGTSPTVQVWRLSDGMPAVALEGVDGVTTYDVAFSPDSSSLAAAGYDGRVRLWNLSTGSLVRTLLPNTGGYVDTVTFSGDGSLLATGGYQGTAEIWRVATGELVRSIAVPTSAHNVHFSPDDSLLVVATVDGIARIWNVTTGELVSTLATTAEMADAEFSPDGRQIASTGDGNVVQIWDAAESTLLQSLSGHGAYISHVVWVDQDRLLSDDWSGAVKLWQRGSTGSFALAGSWSTGGQGLGIAVSPDKTTFVVGGGGAGKNGFVFLALTPPSSQVAELAAGWYHTCALMTDSTVRCWGNNYGGMIGDGTSGNTVAMPTPVTGLSGAIHVAADYTDSCAQMSDHSLKCWGSNNYGQLGDGTTSQQATPVSVLGGRLVEQIALGEYHSCVLLPDGTVGWYGLSVTAPATTHPNTTLSTVPGLTSVRQLSVGPTTNCATLIDDTVSCWRGPLGDGMPISSVTPAPIAGLSSVEKIAVATNTICALMLDKTVRCWGDNGYGAVGDGTTVYQGTPTVVPALSAVADLVAGEYHFCALLTSGAAQCWGRNAHGELGDGTKTDRPTPVNVVGLTGVKQLSLGVTHSCALLQTGAVMCWGNELAYVSNNSPYAGRLTPSAIVF
jgi:WD40 repeat protein